MGAGKTTLCRLIAESWGAGLVLEPSEDNPFLEPFYNDPKRFAFPVQMFYLINRWRQQDGIRQADLFQELVVSDYLFEKDRLFAEQTLEAMELSLYDRFAGALGESAPKPDLILYLDIPTEVLLQRISRRARPGESAISAEYIDDLRARYERLWARYTDAPVLRLDNRTLNYADDEEARERILTIVRGALFGGAMVGRRAEAHGQPTLFGA